MIAMGVVIGVLALTLLVVIVTVCTWRHRQREGKYRNMIYMYSATSSGTKVRTIVTKVKVAT